MASFKRHELHKFSRIQNGFHESCEFVKFVSRISWLHCNFPAWNDTASMRYLVKARLKPGQKKPLLAAIEAGTLGQGSVAGDEYLDNMRQARVTGDGTAHWVETCFCATPLAEERPYWEKYFELVSVKDAHARRNCRDWNGTEPWACCDCDCTRRLEEKLRSKGESFLENLDKDGTKNG